MHVHHRPTRGEQGPAIPLADELVSDGVERPAIPAVRRFDHDDRTSADLERAATALLRDAGDLAAWNLAPAPYAADDGSIRTPGMHHVDTVHRYTRQPQVAPDPVAFLGEQRWEPRAALTYRTEPIIDVIDTGVPGTEVVRSRFVSVATGRGYRFVGHDVERGNIEQTRDHRRTSSKARGGQWAEVLTASEGTIRRRWARATDEQRENARHLVNALRTDGTVTIAGCVVALTIAPNERVTVLAGDDRLTGGSFTLDSFARRIALKD